MFVKNKIIAIVTQYNLKTDNKERAQLERI